MARIFRGIMKIIGITCALPFVPFLSLFGWIASLMDRFSDFSIILGYFPFYWGEYIRYFYYKILLDHVGSNVTFKFGSYCQYRNIVIGNNCLIRYHNVLGQVIMGNDILLGSNIIFTSGTKQHGFDNTQRKIKDQPGKRITINIGSDIWIGNGSVVCSDINDRAVIGAGATVISSIPGYGVYGGNPAKLIRHIGTVINSEC